MFILRILMLLAVLLSWTCCTPLLDLAETGETFGITGADLSPPVLGPSGSSDAYTFELQFNEDLGRLILEAVVPEIAGVEVTVTGSSVQIQTTAPQVPGKEYSLDLRAVDKSGNSQQLLVRCYGFNPDIPRLLINEFTPQGSSTHPDLVELRVMEEGNLAGVCLYEGTCTNWSQRIVLPECSVNSGEYLLIHFKPQGIPDEVNETDNTAVSGGLDSHPGARDFWVEGGTGLSGNNGVIALYSNPFGDVLDAVVYSNRTSASDTDYRGFGSTAVLDRVDTMAEANAWLGEDELLRPEDCVNPEDSTATRSICRLSSAEDTDCSADWHIVPTSTCTFGDINSDEIYVP